MASTVHRCKPARIVVLASIRVLGAIVLAGCGTHDATGSTGSTEVAGGGGASGSGDDGAAPLQGSIDGGATDDSGTTDRGVTAVDSGQGHEICRQSWSVVGSDDPQFYPQRSERMVALDGAGNLFVAASFSGTVNVAGQTFESAGTLSLLVVKLDPACRVLWAKAFGAAQATVGVAGVATDAAGDVVVAGSLVGAAVDFGSGPAAPGSDGHWAGVVFKLGPSGQGLWSHAYPAGALTAANIAIVDVAVDSLGHAVFAAVMSLGASVKGTVSGLLPASVDFGGGAVKFSSSLVELDENGQFVFGVDTSLGNLSQAYCVTTGSAGRIWVAGTENGPGGTLEIIAFDASGDQEWAQSLSGHVNQWDPTVRVDTSDDVVSAAGWLDLENDGGLVGAPLLYKLSAGGSPSWTPPAAIPATTCDAQYRWTNNAWWEEWPGGRLAVDSSGRAIVSSAFAGSANFDSVGSLTSAGGLDSVILRFDAQGRLIAGERWGGAEDDLPVDVAVDAAGDAVVAGWSVPPVDLEGGSAGPQSGSSYAIFVAKLGW